VHRWSRFWGLSRAERRVLAQALVLLPLTVLALRLLGFRACKALLARLASRVTDPSVGMAEARGVARMVDVAARHGVFEPTCLPRSLALWWLLRRRRMASELRIGVRKEAGCFEAHAWVELHGVVLNDGGDVHERFAAFARAVVPAGGVAL
jgi:hypothetical protein